MSDSKSLPVPRRGLDLLATIKAVDSAGAITTKCFGNILELGCETMLLESHREQSTGAALLLNLVFPGQQPRSNPVVTLHCVVRRPRDRARLHYELAIVDMNDETRGRLIEFLRDPERKRKSESKDGSEWA